MESKNEGLRKETYLLKIKRDLTRTKQYEVFFQLLYTLFFM